MKTPHQERVEALQKAYESGRTFATIVKIRDFLGCELDQAKRADLEARNAVNENPSTPVVIPAPKVPDPTSKGYARRSRGNAYHDLLRLLAFSQEVVTKAQNLGYQARKISDKHNDDIDVMRLARDCAMLSKEAESTKREIERVRQGRGAA